MKKIIALISLLAPLQIYSQWEIAYGPLPGTAWITDISFVNDSVGYASVHDVPQVPGDVRRYNIVLKTIDYANTWDTAYIQEFICPCGTTRSIMGIHFTDELNGWACFANSDTLLHTADGGITWSSVDTGLHEMMMGNLAADDFGDIQFSSENFGIAYSNNEGLHSMITQDGGQTWTLADDINGFDLHLKDNCEYASARQGSILLSSDCVQQAIPFWPVDETPMRWVGQIHFWSPENFICGATGLIGFNNFASILKTVDGGNNYHIVDIWNGNVDMDIAFFNELDGYCSVSPSSLTPLILKTQDGGLTWFEQEVEENQIDIVPVLVNINITSENIAYANEEQFIYRTLNGGGPLGDVHTSTRTISKPQTVTLYPNPVQNEITISDLSGNIEQMKFTIFNVNQQPIMAGADPSAIDVSALASGLYHLQIISEGKILQARFVKE